MTNLAETSVFEAGIYQLETADPVLGGPGGIANRQAQLLANRTKYLKDKTDAIQTVIDGDLATKAYVVNAIDGIQSVSVAGGVDVTLNATQSGAGILKLTGAITANINVILPTNSGQWIVDNATTGAFNITLKHTAGTGVVAPAGYAVVVYSDATNVKFASSAAQVSLTATDITPATGTTVITVVGGYTPGNLLIEKNGILLQRSEYTATNGSTVTLAAATIAGDAFTTYAFKSFEVANAVSRSGDSMGGPLLMTYGSTAPTASAGDSSTLLANTAFVQAALAGILTNLASNGYLKLQNGFILQWGSTSAIASGSNQTITLPIAFPVGPLSGIAGLASGSNLGGNYSFGMSLLSSTQIVVYAYGATSAGAFWFVIGH